MRSKLFSLGRLISGFVTLRVWLTIGLLSIAAALSCTPPSSATTPTTISCADCLLIPVGQVIDGDTFDSSYECFAGSCRPSGAWVSWSRVRLYGVDAPERGDRCFREATDRLRELAGDGVRVELGPRRMDEFGRVLAYVYTEAGDSVDETLVREGLAKAWTRDGQHGDVLVAAEREAQHEGVGCLW